MTMPRRFHAAAIALVIAACASSAASARAAPPAAAPAGCTGPASPYWINVVADGLRSGEGLLAVTLYEDVSRKFLAKKGSLYVGRVPAVAGTTRACIYLPKPGVYALALYHDENANQKFDRTGIGFPAEGYGFSNNPSTLAGLPSFRAVRLSIPRASLTSRVHMKYP
jgi:uncharacterized protein (DUF2141 family)